MNSYNVLLDEERTALVPRFDNQQLVSVSCPCPDLDPSLAPSLVFRHSLGQARFYWADGQTGQTHVGWGVAADLQAWGVERFQAVTDQVQSLFDDAYYESVDGGPIPADAEPQLFGGFAFSSDFTPDNTWSIYHPAEFVLPHYQLSIVRGGDNGDNREDDQIWLTLNTLIDRDEDPSEDAASIAGQLKTALAARVAELRELALAEGNARPPLDSINYPMAYPQWAQMMTAALEEFAAERLQKVVLSRVCEIRFGDTVDVDSALDYLNGAYPGCTRFVFEPRPHHAFFGASPETLARLEGQTITTMGLAGTTRRSPVPDEDQALGQALLDSTKDQHEHKVVVDAIRRRLEPLCSELSLPNEPDLLKLSNIQHLFTPIHGQLSGQQTIFDLVELLHPTPALGGAPRADALTFIDEQEPVPRGWYAAPVGIVNRTLDGTFCVAIRSAVAEYERVWLHAGAGIVAGSDPQSEWDEIALKFRPILNALDVKSDKVNG